MVTKVLPQYLLVPAMTLPDARLSIHIRIVLQGLACSYLVSQVVLQYLRIVVQRPGVEFQSCCT